MPRFFRRKDLRKLIPSLLLIVLISIIFTSCEDDPSAIGGSLLPGDDKFKFDTLNTQITPIAQRSSFFKDQVDLGAATRVFLGKTADVQSSLLLRFRALLPDSVLNEIKKDSINVLGSWMELYPILTMGDESEPYDFTINKIEEDWLPSNFNKDSLNLLNVGTEDVIISKTITDTLITIGLETSLVDLWVQTVFDSVSQNFGILLKPTDNTNKILGFQGISSSAEKLPVLKVIVEKPGSFTDTLDLPVNADIHVPDGDFPTSTDDSIILQGGLTSKGKLFFDLTNVIPLNATANSAKLVLTIDTLNSFMNNNSSESINYSILSDSAANEIDEGFGTLALTKSGNQYIDNNFVQFLNRWLNGVDNQGVRLRINNENSTLSRLKIYGSTSDVEVRPKLIVTYSF
jgi:hypothetical protein